MSFHSMTGFGKGEAIGTNYTLSVEIKSVNHRFKDYRFKMSSLFNSMEIGLKKMLEQSFSRGSFEVFINYKKDAEKNDFIEIDTEKVLSFVNVLKEVSEKSGIDYTFQPTEFLRSDFLKENTFKEDELLHLLPLAFEKAVDQLAISRKDEGMKLIEKLKQHQIIYFEHFNKISDYKNSYQEMVREKLLQRFEKIASDLTIDEPRFLQEVIYYLEKLDIEEEITRINIHLKKLSHLLNGNGEVGRQIEFLLQELGRETNTIGSKSGHNDISECVVQMKVQLEKIREQALNLQ